MRFPAQYFQDVDRRARTNVEARNQEKAARHRQIVAATKLRAADADQAQRDAMRTKRVTDLQPAIKVQDAEKDKSMLGNLAQQMDFKVWLPACAKVYKISPRIEDYILVSTVVCPSDIPNRNGIGFPAAELAKFQPPPMNRMVYKAWSGCPVHLEHANEIHEDAYGVILDTVLTRVTGYGGGKLWKVMGLKAIDKNKYPDIAQEVLDGSINTYSMGAMVEMFQCSYCGTECYLDPKTERHIGCRHISSIRNVNWGVEKGPDGQDHLSFLNAYGISPIESSIVRDPAWAPALSDNVWEYEKTEPDVKKVVQQHQRPPVTDGGGNPPPKGPSLSFMDDLYKLKW